MKRVICFLLIFALLGTLAACKPQDNPSDDLEVNAGELTGGNTDDQKEPDDREDQTSTPTPDEKPQETPDDQTKEPDKTPEKEPEKEPEKDPEKEPEKEPDKTPEEEPETESKKAYLVGVSVEKADRPRTAKVKDSDILSLVYGQDTAFQNGDTVVFKVEISTGATTGFRFVKNSAKNCTISVDKNLITMNIDQKDQELDKAEFAITGSDENGLLEKYAEKCGLQFVEGGDTAIDVTHRQGSGHIASEEWVEESVGFIDQAKAAGCKYYYYYMVDSFQFYAGTNLR